MNPRFARDTWSSTYSPFSPERHAGALAAHAWLMARGLPRPIGGGWDVAIALEVADRPAPPSLTNPAESRFHLSISSTEWGFLFCHRGRVSWIRVTDVPYIHDRDDHGLLGRVPPLRDVGALVHAIEHKSAIRFRRDHASVRTNLAGAEPGLRAWITAAL
jgi:hypothetical protein